MHLRQRFMIGILAGGALVAELSLSPTAVAAGSPAVSGAGTNNDTISTNVSISTHGAVGAVPSPLRDPPGIGPGSPQCWLSPFAGDGAPTPTYTPAAFGTYMNNQITLETGGGAKPAPASDAYQYMAVYQNGIVDSNLVGLTVAPYNKGVTGGTWDFEVCSQGVTWQTILGVEQARHVTNPDEQWFWVNNADPAAPAYVLSPSVLAEYAVANLTPKPQWPKSAPDFLTQPSTVNSLTTVELPTGPSAAAVVAALGYTTDSATASLTLDPAISSTVTAVPVSITITSPDIKAPVTCNFALLHGVYSLGDSCQIEFTVPSPPGGTDPVSASEIWSANWTGGGANWPRNLPAIQLPTENVDVQEIQAIVGPPTPAP